jgi:hypothetical protein
VDRTLGADGGGCGIGLRGAGGECGVRGAEGVHVDRSSDWVAYYGGRGYVGEGEARGWGAVLPGDGEDLSGGSAGG